LFINFFQKIGEGKSVPLCNFQLHIFSRDSPEYSHYLSIDKLVVDERVDQSINIKRNASVGERVDQFS